MREILFRGKQKDNGEWVEGRLLADGVIVPKGQTIEIFRCWIENRLECRVVIPETVGQYTGLTDKNGTKIFEGDIVDVEYNPNYIGVAKERIGTFEVVFDNGCFMKQNDKGLFHFISSDVCVVIGNIHDNPELLGGAE